MNRHGWLLALLTACAPATSQAPSAPEGASLVVTLEPSHDVPTGVRMEVSNPNAGAVSFCPYQTPFEGAMDDIFEVRTPDGVELPFRGPILERAACEPDEWFPVQPGRFHTAEADLTHGYPVQPGQVYMVRYRGSAVAGLPPSDWLDITIE
ncbi:MAG: hypothetical protein ACE37F_07295 [Nannocystaceae bacterium]|nr:hypothetical protein [bacterium]